MTYIRGIVGLVLAGPEGRKEGPNDALRRGVKRERCSPHFILARTFKLACIPLLYSLTDPWLLFIALLMADTH